MLCRHPRNGRVFFYLLIILITKFFLTKFFIPFLGKIQVVRQLMERVRLLRSLLVHPRGARTNVEPFPNGIKKKTIRSKVLPHIDLMDRSTLGL